MSLTFGHTFVPNFGRIFERQPQLLTRHPYLNYLRIYKRAHPKYSLNRLLQRGAKAWQKLSANEKMRYTQKELFKRQHQRNNAIGKYLLPRARIPAFCYKRRSLNAEKNIARSWQHKKRYTPPQRRLVEQIIDI